MDIESNIVKTDTYGNSITLQKAIQNAEIITLDVGANDILNEININKTTGEIQFDQQQMQSTLNKLGENLINILTKIKTLNPNVDIYLMGFYYPFPYLSDNAQAQLLPLLNLLNKTIAEAGKPFQATFIPTAEAISQNPKAFLPNPLDIHPNKEGYLQLANAFWNKINVKKPTSFQDEIPDWALAEIQYLAQKGIINGYSNGSFGYDDHITRVHSGIMLDRSVIYNNESAPNPSYLDVAETTYGFDVISRLTKQGIFTGDNYYFYPDQSLTRAEMAKILVKAFQLTGTTPHPYSDVASDHWGAEYISILTENQITNGYPDGTFKPDHYITRAEFSKMLALVLNDRLVEKKK